MNRETAASLIRESPLGAHASLLEGLLLPSVRLKTERVEQSAISMGESRFGGEPDLPEDVEWPTFRGSPLGFVAQVRLADLMRFESSLALPNDGWLLFFYDAAQRTWGYDPADRGSAQVLHVPASAALSRRRLPPPDEECFDSHPCRLSFEQRYDFVDEEYGQPSLPFDVQDNEAWDAYIELSLALTGDDPTHHLFGHPQPVQCEMRLECQLVTNGISCGDSEGSKDPRAAELADGAADWGLLLQVDTDEDGPGWQWGMGGRLYFWMRRGDAAANAFEQAWLILQC